MAVTQTTIIFNGQSYPVNQCSADQSTRIVYDDSGNLVSCFQSAGVTQTIRTLFTGTAQECADQANSLGLTATDAVLTAKNPVTTLWSRPITTFVPAPVKLGGGAVGKLV